MISRQALSDYCDQYLNVAAFKDYCPNGLQIEGRDEISHIISGVSANIDMIERAIDEKADALFVHHGFFWKNEKPNITGIKRQRIGQLLTTNINLFAYHLPLDAHAEVGNNIELAKRLNIQNPQPIGDTLVWQGELDLSLSEFSKKIHQALSREPLVLGNGQMPIKQVSWCTGGAQSYIDYAIDIGADCFLTGEISEQIPAIAKENSMAFISAGHHATERYGIQALCQHLAQKFDLKHQFIDIDNQV